MIIPNTWSFSRWQTWDKCPFAYKAKFILKLPDPPSPAMERGNKVHKAIDAYLTGRGPLPPEVKSPFHRQLYDEMRQHERKMVEQKWGFTKSWRSTGFFDNKSVWLRAICDVVLLYDDDSVEVVDHKTGKKYGHNDDQVELFALTTFMQFGQQAKNGVRTRLIYLDSDQEDVSMFDHAAVEGLRAKWNNRADDMLSDRRFISRAGCRCRWCEMKRAGEITCE